MGVYWRSNAEILTEKNTQAKSITSFINTLKRQDNSYSLYNLDHSECSITFSSNGYGSFETLFSEICNKFEFPIFCHERVLPSQSQGYGFFLLYGRWLGGEICKYQENVYYDYNDKNDSNWADSVQLLNIPKNWLLESNQLLQKKDKEKIHSILKNSENNGTPINPSKLLDEDGFEMDSEVYYLKDFLDNCIPEDEDSITQIFESELENMCTWNQNIEPIFYNEYGEEVMGLPENIDYNNMRLVFKK